MTSSSQPSQPSAFVGVFRNFNVDPEQLRNLLTTYWVEHSNAINLREIGLYDLVEQVTGQQFFIANDPLKKRFGYRRAYQFGSIAAGATSTQAHGLTNVTIYTHIYGTAVTTAENIPLPYVSTAALNQQVSLRVVGANIEIINGAGANNITSAIVVLEYLKQ